MDELTIITREDALAAHEWLTSRINATAARCLEAEREWKGALATFPGEHDLIRDLHAEWLTFRNEVKILKALRVREVNA